MKKEQLSEQAYQHKLEYNKEYKKKNKDKINKYAREYNKNKNYSTDYIKSTYKRMEIRVRYDNGDYDKIQQVLQDRNITLKDYVMEKINEDLK